MLRVEQLVKEFGGLRAVNGCSFSVEAGSIFGLIGPNGSGKTTVFNLVAGFLAPTSGQVFFGDQEITGLPPYAIAQRGISRTFQLVRVFRRLTVIENLLMAPQRQAGENVLLGLLRTRRVRQQEQQALDHAWELLAMVGLAHLGNAECGSLSLAEQKMVEITRAMMSEPKIILLDEPASGINPSLLNQILDYIRRLRDQQGKTFLLVEHDMRVVMSLCDRVAVLNYGEKIAEGLPREVAETAAVIDAYLGV